MKTINAKVFAIKYKLAKMLNASLEKDKNAIKEGAKITRKDYCKIQIVECNKASYTKEQQKMLDEYAQEIGLAKVVTTYTRINIDNIPTEVDDKVNEIFNTLENDNDKDIKRVASKVANIK